MEYILEHLVSRIEACEEALKSKNLEIKALKKEHETITKSLYEDRNSEMTRIIQVKDREIETLRKEVIDTVARKENEIKENKKWMMRVKDEMMNEIDFLQKKLNQKLIDCQVENKELVRSKGQNIQELQKSFQVECGQIHHEIQNYKEYLEKEIDSLKLVVDQKIILTKNENQELLKNIEIELKESIKTHRVQCNDNYNELQAREKELKKFIDAKFAIRYLKNDEPFEWLIKDFNKLRKNGFDIFSDVFYSPLTGYYFRLNAVLKNKKDNLSLYIQRVRSAGDGLGIVSNNEKFEVTFQCIGQDNALIEHCFTSNDGEQSFSIPDGKNESKSLGFISFIKFGNFKEQICDNSLHLACRMQILEE